MTSRLALTLPLRFLETPPSFVARLARLNGSIPTEFCSDLGLNWPHVCSGHEDQLQGLSDLSGVQLDDLRFTSAQLTGPATFEVGCTHSTTGGFRRAMTRVCPKCILDAYEQEARLGPWQRLDWLVRAIEACPEHHLPLVQLPQAKYTHKSYDITAQVKRHLPLLEEGLEAKPLAPLRFELAVMGRIVHGPSENWLQPLGLWQLYRASQSLGAVMCSAETEIKSNTLLRREVTELGYSVLVRGRIGRRLP